MAFCLREKRSIPFITSSRCALSVEYNAANSDLAFSCFSSLVPTTKPAISFRASSIGVRRAARRETRSACFGSAGFGLVGGLDRGPGPDAGDRNPRHLQLLARPVRITGVQREGRLRPARSGHRNRYAERKLTPRKSHAAPPCGLATASLPGGPPALLRKMDLLVPCGRALADIFDIPYLSQIKFGQTGLDVRGMAPHRRWRALDFAMRRLEVRRRAARHNCGGLQVFAKVFEGAARGEFIEPSPS